MAEKKKRILTWGEYLFATGEGRPAVDKTGPEKTANPTYSTSAGRPVNSIVRSEMDRMKASVDRKRASAPAPAKPAMAASMVATNTPPKTTRVDGLNRSAGGAGIAALPTNDKNGFAVGTAKRGGGYQDKKAEKYWYGSTTSDFGPRVSEAAKLERLRATRAASSKAPSTSAPAAAAPIPKAKPKVTVKAAAAPAVKAKPVAKKAVKPALPSSTGKVTGKSVTLQQKKFKSAYARRMADRYSIGPNGRSM